MIVLILILFVVVTIRLRFARKLMSPLFSTMHASGATSFPASTILEVLSFPLLDDSNAIINYITVT